MALGKRVKPFAFKARDGLGEIECKISYDSTGCIDVAGVVDRASDVPYIHVN